MHGFARKVLTASLLVSNTPRVAAESRAEQLRIDEYCAVFLEEFDGPLDVSPWGPGTKWIAHTPWHGDFGDAVFADPSVGFPFQVRDGVLRIEARKAKWSQDSHAEQWRSGLLASCDPKGRGFSLQYGYFEMSAKLPDGRGVWPGFWLNSAYISNPPADDGLTEIDVLEYYGFDGLYNVTVHTWGPKPHNAAAGTVSMPRATETSTFHRYGVDVRPDFVTFYFDRVAVWKTPTPASHRRPQMILLNLALGGGWPIDEVVSPSFMYVDYVRAYRHRGAEPCVESGLAAGETGGRGQVAAIERAKGTAVEDSASAVGGALGMPAPPQPAAELFDAGVGARGVKAQRDVAPGRAPGSALARRSIRSKRIFPEKNRQNLKGRTPQTRGQPAE